MPDLSWPEIVSRARRFFSKIVSKFCYHNGGIGGFIRCIWNFVDRSVLFCFIWKSRGVSSDRQNLPKPYSNVIFSHFNGFRLPCFYKGIFIWMEFWKVLAIVFHSKKRRSKNVEMRKSYILIYFLEGFTFSTPAFCWPHRDAQMMPPGVSCFPPQPGSRFPAPGSRLPAPGSLLPAPGSRFQALAWSGAAALTH